MSDVNRSEAAPATASDGDVAALIGVFRRNILLILGIAAVVVAAMLAYLTQAKPRYTARAVVALAPQKAEVGRDANQGPAPVPKDADVDAQVEDLKSRDLAVTVVKQLHLDTLPGVKVAKPALRGAQGPDVPPPEPGVTPEQAAAADNLSAHLKSRRMGQTFLTEISYTDRSPVLAARVANAVAEAYVAKELDAKNQVSRNTNGALTGKLDSLRQQVLEADSAVAAYQTSHNLLGANDAPLSQQDLALQSAQVVGAQNDEAQATARYNAARVEAARSGSGEAMSEAQASPVITQLRAQRADAARKVAELQTRYGPLYPDLVTAKHELAELDTQISAELSRIMSSLRSQADSARARSVALQSSNEQLRHSLAAGTTATVQLDDLKRKAEAARTLYADVLARSKETSVQQAFAVADVRIDTPATPPSVPSSPNKPVDIFLSIVLGLGLGLGCGVALIRDRMVRGLSTSEEVERRLNVPFLGSIPTLASSVKKAKTGSPIEAIGKHPFSNFAESFRTLATSLRHARESGEVRTLLVTSALPGEGKTTTAICLARVIAMGGSSVAFLDCDLRRRSASALLRLQPEHGLIEVLSGRARIEDAMVTLPEMGFDVLPLAKEAHLAKSPFESKEMDELLAYLKTRYDIVVMDTAPVLPVIDTRVLAEKADAVALLARWRNTPAQATATALRMLTALNVRVDGVALTQVDLKQQARAGNTSDAAYYYKAYQGYYTD